jgi:hypothetical protein
VLRRGKLERIHMSGNSRSSAEAALKTLSRVLIERVGGLDPAEAALNSGGGRGVRRSQLANYYNPHCNQFLPIDLAARLEEVAEDPVVTAELARRSGFVLVRENGMAGDCVLRKLATLAAENADLQRAAAESLADGQLCEDDLARIEREAMEMHRAIGNLLATIRARRAQPGMTVIVEGGTRRGMAGVLAAMRAVWTRHRAPQL